MRRLSLIWLLICAGGLLCLFPSRAKAQNAPPSPRPSSSRTEAPYFLPQTIFVGDPGRLVVPLGQAFAGVEPFVSESPGELPETPDLVIRRLELEHRGGLSRILIDFIPYAPGLLSFPPFTFSLPGAEPLTVTGLEARVASILTPSQTALSGPVPPLSVPGTSFLIYGTASLILILLFLGIGGSLWGRRHFGELWERFHRRHLLRIMAKFLRRLEHEGEIEKKGKPGYYLTLLSGELREFLSLFTGVNCRSLTSGELLTLPLGYTGAGEGSPASSPLLAPDFLCGLFRTWDNLRFSGRNIDKIDLFMALKNTKNFIIALDRAEREKKLPKSLWGSGRRETGAGASGEADNGF